jgi:hypothetical protein
MLMLSVSALSEDKKLEESLKKIEGVIGQGPYSASWDSLEKFKVPKWYEDAKFGIFIHWGLYCVPAFDSEWYPRNTAQDIRFTAKGDTLYAIALAWPEDGKLTIKSLASGSELTKRDIKTVQMLGSKAKVKWTRSAEGLIIEMPNEKPGSYAFALKIFPVDRAAGQAP